LDAPWRLPFAIAGAQILVETLIAPCWQIRSEVGKKCSSLLQNEHRRPRDEPIDCPAGRP